MLLVAKMQRVSGACPYNCKTPDMPRRDLDDHIIAPVEVSRVILSMLAALISFRTA